MSDPADPAPPLEPARPRRRPMARVGHATGWLVLGVLVLCILAGIAALALTDRVLVLPDWATRRIETQLNTNVRQGAIDVGEIALRVDRHGVPRVALLNVAVRDGNGTRVAMLERVQVTFDPAALIRGRIALRRVALAGARIALKRDADGQLSLSFGQGASAFPGLPALLDGMERVLEQGPYASLDSVTLSDLAVRLEDARSARVWQITGGTARLSQSAGNVDISVRAEVFNGTDAVARADLSLTTMRRDSGAALSVQIANVAAQDIALQAPALAFLGVLDAPISGALRAGLDGAGMLDRLDGTLEIGAGAVQPRPGTDPLQFERARTYFSYAPADQKISFSEISVTSHEATGKISGHAYLRDLTDQGWPRALVGQFQVGELSLFLRELFEAPVVFRSGSADVRLRLDPFTLDIGQAVLSEPDGVGGTRSYRARGRVRADPDGWNTALDVTTDAVPVKRALTLWPVPLAAKTRTWLQENIAKGMLNNVDAAFRKLPGTRRTLAASFAFSDAELTFMPTMPTIMGGSGAASVMGERFALMVDSGTVDPGTGGLIDLAGSTMVVPNTRQKPALGEFSLATSGSLTAILALLDRPPLNILKDSPLGPDLAEAQARLIGNLKFEMRKGLKLDDVDFAVSGTLEDLVSDRLVPGHEVQAKTLSVDVTPAAVMVAGAAGYDGVPVTARWRMGLAPGERGNSRVTGRIELSDATVKRLNLGLPEGTVSGRGQGDLTVTLARGAAPRVTLTSDLAGVGLSLSGLGWTKPAGARGRLDVAATLGATPRVDNLSLNAAGLKATGEITLKGGALARATFKRVQLEDWLDAPVTLSGRGKGAAPAIALTRGRLDIRKAGFAKGGGGGAARGPVTLALDQLVVSEGISLTAFTGQLAAGRSLSGRFTARVNGGAWVSGDLVGEAAGVALRLRAEDGGQLLRDTGLVTTAHDGPMEFVLRPTGQRGTWDGTLKVGRIRIRGAPAIADLLGAISVVGLLEQLNGDGLVFDETEASFRLTPAQLILYRSSAVGASLGISMDGVYDLARRSIDMQGVISPIYLLNGIGSIFTRRGEGLFGFNFRLTGAAARPSVSVNPLSILTPGMFREIFRRPAPVRGQ